MTQHQPTEQTQKRHAEQLRNALYAKILRPKVAADYLGVSRRHLYHLAEFDPNFPRKIVFSSRCVGWSREALDEWLTAKEGAA